jgi:hypothetical protein
MSNKALADELKQNTTPNALGPNHHRAPVPYAPDVHPVLTSQTAVPWRATFSASMDAYLVGCQTMKAEPKQAEKVASGSVTPISVPATLAV